MPKRFDKPGAGPTQRQLRVGELLRRRLSELLLRGEIHDPALAGTSVIVTEVRPSPDLRQALVMVSALGGGKREPKIVEALNANAKLLRKEASRGLDLKFAPQLKFTADVTFDKMDETRKLFADPKVAKDIAKDETETDLG